ncbi:metal ABC transporter ATP-binding protein [Szabonella alba]|uniref:ATP-binding cassette domain-containing protein n=1 Tax=Szabonella alba TaxID=2804194 RepID=A0A8K0VDE4_9RHOB|nr:metal ABC transporter ATP-binding protein [Szabonella alba]MBL4918133.1 ATP-binding cassette domain-containing protein [Szabonella alba]
MTLVSVQSLAVRFGGAEVLRDIDLSVSASEIVTIVGPNGSGKSTLLRAMLGIQPASSGRVMRKAGLRIGYVPQRLAIDRSLPMTARRFLSLPRRVSDAEAAAALDRCGVGAVAERQLVDLSGGQLQRVLFARALIGRPELLVLDEPTQGLDQPGEAAFYQLIADVRAETGAAVLMVSHDLHVVMAASDRVICLNGHVCCEGTPQVVRDAPEYRALFGYGTQGALALYRHDHDHNHGPGLAHHHDAACDHDHSAPDHAAKDHAAKEYTAAGHAGEGHSGTGPHHA